MLSMIWLPTRDLLLAVHSTKRQLFRPIHPVHTGIYVMFIRGPNLQYPGYPVICLRRGFAGAGRQRVLPFHGCLVRHIDKVFSVVFDTIDYTVATWLAARSPDVARDVREVTLTNEAVVACHVEPLLAGVDGVVELQGLA